MSGTEGYVQQWLSHTEIDAPRANMDARVSYEAHDRTRSRETDRAIFDGERLPSNRSELLEFMQKRYEPKSAGYRKRKRGPTLSPESSFLETAFPVPNAKSPTREELKLIEKHESSARKKRRGRGPFLSELNPLDKRPFERRPRHKTKEDRYEPKIKSKYESKDRVRKKMKKSGTRKIERDGDDVPLKKFHSQLVGHHRLTLKHDQGGTFFKQGRLSTEFPGGEAVPDLAFSEMRFLQEPRRHSADLADEGVMSKARRGGCNMKERPPDDISSFFKPDQPSGKELVGYLDEVYQSGLYQKFDDKTPNSFQMGDQANKLRFPYRHRDSSRATNKTTRSSLAPDANFTSLPGVSPYSGTENSFPYRTSRPNKPMIHRRTSSITIPEDVQHLLHQSGIYSHTRLNKPSSSPHRKSNRNLVLDACENSSSQDCTKLWGDFVRSTRTAAPSDTLGSPTRPDHTEASSPKSIASEISLQHHDTQAGWHHGKAEPSPRKNERTMQSKNLPHVSTRNPDGTPEIEERLPSREQLASAARVNAPSTRILKEKRTSLPEYGREKAPVAKNHEPPTSVPPVLVEPTSNRAAESIAVRASPTPPHSTGTNIYGNTTNEARPQTEQSNDKNDERLSDCARESSEDAYGILNLTTSANLIDRPTHVHTIPYRGLTYLFGNKSQGPIDCTSKASRNSAHEPSSHYHGLHTLPNRDIPFSNEILFDVGRQDDHTMQIDLQRPRTEDADHTVYTSPIRFHETHVESFNPSLQNHEDSSVYLEPGGVNLDLHNAHCQTNSAQYFDNFSHTEANGEYAVDDNIQERAGFNMGVSGKAWGHIDNIEDLITPIPGFWRHGRQ